MPCISAPSSCPRAPWPCVCKGIPLLQGLPAWLAIVRLATFRRPRISSPALLYFSARALDVLVWSAGSTMTGLPTVGGSLAGLSFLMARCTAFAALAVRADLELRRCGFVAMDCSNLRDCKANVARTGQVPEHIARRSLQAWVFEASASVFRRGRGADLVSLQHLQARGSAYWSNENIGPRTGKFLRPADEVVEGLARCCADRCERRVLDVSDTDRAVRATRACRCGGFASGGGVTSCWGSGWGSGRASSGRASCATTAAGAVTGVGVATGTGRSISSAGNAVNGASRGGAASVGSCFSATASGGSVTADVATDPWPGSAGAWMREASVTLLPGRMVLATNPTAPHATTMGKNT